MLDKESHVALVLFRRPRAPRGEEHVHASPFRTVLSWWFSLRECVLVHAASVGTRDGGVLLCGNGGSGKSTTAFSCLGAGLLYAGDDSVLLANGAPPTIHSLYGSGGLKRSDTAKFPFLKDAQGPFRSFRSQKDLFLFAEESGGPVVTDYPLRAILALRLSDKSESTLTPASWRTALMAMAPSTLCQFSGDSQERFAQLSRLAESVPAFILDVGTDVRDIPKQIQGLLDDIGNRVI
jgi:hypothetical protein